MGKLIYLAGLLAFGASWFFPACPNQMNSPEGETVKVWYAPVDTHFRLALEPMIQWSNYVSIEFNPVDRGDGYDTYRAEAVRRIFYSLPAAVGYFLILGSVIFAIARLRRPLMDFPRVRFIAGVVLMLACLLLAIDYVDCATAYRGYFHLGAGAYLVCAAYLGIGLGLLVWRKG